MAKKEGKKEKLTLSEAIAKIEKDYGKGSVMKLGENKHMKIDVISSGILSLDLALGVGGYPKGRIVEIYGPESLGVDIDNLLLAQPDTGEQALEICEALVRTDEIAMVVIDSVAALVPEAEIEGTMGSSQVGLQARLMSQALRKLAGTINKTNTIAIFINQLREKVGVMFGNPETTTGGRALKFYATIRLDIRKKELIQVGQNTVGTKTLFKVVKNKVAPPFKQAYVDIMYGEGVTREGELVELGTEADILEKSGSWYSYNGEKLGQGKETVKEYLKNNPKVAEELEAKIREHYNLNGMANADLDDQSLIEE